MAEKVAYFCDGEFFRNILGAEKDSHFFIVSVFSFGVSGNTIWSR